MRAEESVRSRYREATPQIKLYNKNKWTHQINKKYNILGGDSFVLPVIVVENENECFLLLSAMFSNFLWHDMTKERPPPVYLQNPLVAYIIRWIYSYPY